MANWTKEQQQAICEDNKNIIVSAGAGSGKTAVLSERVIRKLKEGVNINELLILTFTKAAASEMKERIRKKISNEPILLDQLDLVDSAYITTFDSYSLSILKKYHYLLNLPPVINITDSSLINLKKEKIIDDIFDGLYQESDLEFEDFINCFCVKDDQEIKKYILNIYSKIESKTDKDTYLENYVNSYFDDNKIKKDIAKYESLLQDKIRIIDEKLKDLSYYVDNEYYLKINAVLELLLSSKDYDDIYLNSNITLPNLPRGSEEEAKERKIALSNEIKNLKQLLKFETKEEIYNSIIKTKKYQEQIIKILSLFDKKLTTYKLDNFLFEFNDIALLSIKILKENENIRNEIKSSLNEIMIDEYQDTNDLQEEFISLIANNNVYMVGDIKQSIYRFRNANPYIFKNKYDNYKLLNGGIAIDLNKNFRSRKEVLDNINLIFDLVMDDTLGGADYRKSHNMIFGNNLYIEKGNTNQNNNFEIYNYTYDKESIYTKEEIEAFIIANDIKDKIKNNYKVFDKDECVIREANYNDFVILMDKSTNFDLYKKIFEYMDIPLTISKDESLNNEMILIVLKNLLNLINKIYLKEYDKEFKHMFISIARSFLFEMSDQEIFDIFNNKDFINNEIFIRSKSISNKLDYLNIKQLLNIVINEFDFYNKMIKIGNISSNIMILDYLINLTNSFIKPLNSIEDYILYLKEMIDTGYDLKISRNEEATDSVKIMTIHKSKGLEFYVCYYTGLYSKFNIRDLNDKILFDNTYGIICPYFDEGIASTIYKDLLKNDYIEEEISEKIRLFYVALTRAKEKMIMVCDFNKDQMTNLEEGIVSSRNNYRSFKDLINSITNKVNDYVTDINLDKIDVSKDYLKIKATNYQQYLNNNCEIIKVDELVNDKKQMQDKKFSKSLTKILSKEENKNIELGLKIHSILEILDFKNTNMIDITTSDFIKQKINSFLNIDILKNVNEAKIYKEYEFIYEEDEIYHGIIDLMIVYDDHIDIIDYKLKDITDSNYQKQLLGYKKYIEKKTKKEVNVYLYSFLDEKISKVNS